MTTSSRKGIYVPWGKRFFDLIFAIAVLPPLLPIMLIVAVAVRIKLGAPVFFLHLRPGFKGKPFTLYKFRTMTADTDSTGKLLPNKERLNPFGDRLRGWSLDELPELINVIKGEMSIVGPRPLEMRYLPRYSAEQMRRHDIRPGLTGWAQVHGRNDVTWEDRLSRDVWYVDHCTFLLDCRIILMTLTKMVSRKSSMDGALWIEEFMGSDHSAR